jgi:uncharacterized protein with FMN-binding domain
MKRIVTWLLSTITIVVLLFGYHTSTAGALSRAQDLVIPSAVDAGGAGGSPRSGGSGSGAPRSASAAQTVTGPALQTQWGPVQVELTTRGGSITDVSVLQHPTGNPTDDRINSYALPILVQETLDAQSADIQMVSGATVTSDGYVQSLQAALDEANL